MRQALKVDLHIVGSTMHDVYYCIMLDDGVWVESINQYHAFHCTVAKSRIYIEHWHAIDYSPQSNIEHGQYILPSPAHLSSSLIGGRGHKLRNAESWQMQ